MVKQKSELKIKFRLYHMTVPHAVKRCLEDPMDQTSSHLFLRCSC